MQNKIYAPIACLIALLMTFASAKADEASSLKEADFSSLTNFQINSDTLVSAGQPEQEDFSKLRRYGVGRVIDLIPGDRSEEKSMMEAMNLEYFNIQVDWENPTLQNFKDYVHYMNVPGNKGDKTLTHCKLNWRGSAFIYLYRVTQLNEAEAVARADMDKIWQPDDTWQAFIDEVKAAYQK